MVKGIMEQEGSGRGTSYKLLPPILAIKKTLKVSSIF
jgi:hypothetical protein